MVDDSAEIPKMIAAIILLLLSVIGLIGMSFVLAVFRWIYLVAVAGMIVGNWFLPVASNKPMRDIAFGDCLGSWMVRFWRWPFLISYRPN
jgi:hypothetical protein